MSDGLLSLVCRQCPNLENLDISNQSQSAIMSLECLELIPEYCKHLRELNISNNLAYFDITSEEIKMLIVGLPLLHTLIMFRKSGCFYGVSKEPIITSELTHLVARLRFLGVTEYQVSTDCLEELRKVSTLTLMFG